jgi:hypothetical protein
MEAVERRGAGTMSGAKEKQKTHRHGHRPPFECVALLLQGGGAPAPTISGACTWCASLSKLLPQLPDELKVGAEYELPHSLADHKVYDIVHMIYRAKHHEGHSKDCELSRETMKDHWEAGYHDAVRTLRHPELFERPHGRVGGGHFRPRHRWPRVTFSSGWPHRY